MARTTEKVIVHLRSREGAKGEMHLYLDISENGSRRKESLGISIPVAKTKMERALNAQLMERAKAMASKRERDLIDKADGFSIASDGLESSFVEWFRSQSLDKSKSTTMTWDAAMKHLEAFSGSRSITFGQLTPAFCKGFRTYLCERSGLSHNSASLMFAKFRAAIKEAINQRVIGRDPLLGIKPISLLETERTHLTRDEVNRLILTPSRCDIAKRAFILSCMTGLRISDIRALSWENIVEQDGKKYISIRQTKTSSMVRIPLNDIAVQALGQSGIGRIFGNLCNVNEIIRPWIEDAGITRKVTFHCARHTFACLALSATGDIYTTSSLLGHRNIRTTQIYAKVMDEAKENAIDKVAKLF